MPFLKRRGSKIKRQNKLKAKAAKCWYLGPAPNHPRDAMRMLCKSGRIIATRNVACAHIPALASPTQQAIVSPNLARDFQGRGDNSEAEEEPASSCEAESQFQSAEGDDMSVGEEESEEASEGQPESAEDRESCGGGDAARPSPPAPRTMVIPAASGLQTG